MSQKRYIMPCNLSANDIACEGIQWAKCFLLLCSHDKQNIGLQIWQYFGVSICGIHNATLQHEEEAYRLRHSQAFADSARRYAQSQSHACAGRHSCELSHTHCPVGAAHQYRESALPPSCSCQHPRCQPLQGMCSIVIMSTCTVQMLCPDKVPLDTLSLWCVTGLSCMNPDRRLQCVSTMLQSSAICKLIVTGNGDAHSMYHN